MKAFFVPPCMLGVNVPAWCVMFALCAVLTCSTLVGMTVLALAHSIAVLELELLGKS